MADVTFEQALDIARALPPEEQRRLLKQLQEDESQRANQSENQNSQATDFREREMRWISEHQNEYAGQWVALDGNRLLSHSTDGRKVYEEAHAMGVKVPFVAYIEDPNKPWMGGW